MYEWGGGYNSIRSFRSIYIVFVIMFLFGIEIAFVVGPCRQRFVFAFLELQPDY